MSDVSRSLQRAAGLCWVLIISAVLLTVAAGVLAFTEVSWIRSSAPRAFVMSGAVVTWIGWIALSCSVLVIKKVNKAINKAKAELLTAICEKRLSNIAEFIDGGNVRMINDRRR